jgi:hypothetical protein
MRLAGSALMVATVISLPSIGHGASARQCGHPLCLAGPQMQGLGGLPHPHSPHTEGGEAVLLRLKGGAAKRRSDECTLVAETIDRVIESVRDERHGGDGAWAETRPGQPRSAFVYPLLSGPSPVRALDHALSSIEEEELSSEFNSRDYPLHTPSLDVTGETQHLKGDDDAEAPLCLCVS